MTTRPARIHWAALAGMLLASLALADDRSAPDAASPDLSRHIQGLFQDGMTFGPKALKAAQTHWQSARRTAPHDPRPDMAYGLVLLRQSQYKPAIAQFESSRQHSGDPYFPAWQAQIWAELVDRQYDQGLAHLLEYAGVVHQSSDAPQASPLQIAAADWMGQVYEALDKTTKTKVLREALAEHYETLREALGIELHIAFELGRDVMRERDLELTHEAAQVREAAEKKQERRKQEELDRLAADLKDLEKEKEDADQSAEGWKKWLEDALGKADKALGELERDYEQLEKRRQSLDQSITMAGRELTAMQVGATATTGLQTQQSLQSQMQRFTQVQAQMLNYQLEYNTTLGTLSQTVQQAQALTQQRAQIVQRYERATGQLVKKDADLDKWSARLADKKQKLDVKPVSAQPAKASTTARKPAATFKSYMPLDLEAEKASLLATFGIK